MRGYLECKRIRVGRPLIAYSQARGLEILEVHLSIGSEFSTLRVMKGY